ncbi:MAG: hypothetical protein K8F28_04380 [Ignavibacteriaceae bacterium]|nr:hypothetical protein [Ignavibacteriaceae bacterium]
MLCATKERQKIVLKKSIRCSICQNFNLKPD